MDCSQLGLEPDGRKVHLIPYGDKCTLIIDYKGLVDLARRSGKIADIHADVVYENDLFKYSYGTDGSLVHKPSLTDRGKPIAAYSFVLLKDGASSYEVMNFDEVDAIHKRSKAGKSGPWITDWAEMAKKTVFRRHSKWLPVSSEFQEAIDKDFDVARDINKGFIDTTAGKPDVAIPEEKVKEKVPEVQLDGKEKPTKPNAYKGLLNGFASVKKKIGDAKYYEILGRAGYEHSNQIPYVAEGQTILAEMLNEVEAK